MKILLLEPHPDDIALNMAGYILSHPEHEYYTILFSVVNSIVKLLTPFLKIVNQLFDITTPL